ncbi:uncharacterized protein BYT42DRAFT_548830 [Radiomyces spectabilis]|uniref:uncharacterized protein n=1 Tax=Radiomyces spectabilis TaxID=64574 RepID=UPI00221F8B48|nr:uncharacterized protein BYT42DRAFT_548830 [Radiomyces spectabilis]KAI8370589.1 hypothetical protein BYT42DRAFT_548830 [Radiomyces spectabilis]
MERKKKYELHATKQIASSFLKDSKKELRKMNSTISSSLLRVAHNAATVGRRSSVVPRRTFTTPSKSTSELKGWRRYKEAFKDKPASYTTTFLVLHELTAIVPFPIIYYGIKASGYTIPVPQDVVAEGNRFINKVRVRYGYDPLDLNNPTMVNLTATYAIVKLLMPARIAASAFLTPTVVERLVAPIVRTMTTAVKAFRKKPVP